MANNNEIYSYMNNEILMQYIEVPYCDVAKVAKRACEMYSGGAVVLSQDECIRSAVQEYIQSTTPAGSFRIVKADITTLDVDAIVNAANSHLQPGGGVCGAIYKAAGYKKLKAETDKIGSCKTGEAVITPGFDLPAKYIVHAVGPVWEGGENNEPELLRNAYTSALMVAGIYSCKTIALPLISAGIYGYPLKDAWREAIAACYPFYRNGMDIVFAVIDDAVLQAGTAAVEEWNAGNTAKSDKE